MPEIWVGTRERAKTIWNVYVALELLQIGDEENRSLFARAIKVLLSPANDPTGCGRDFRALYEEDRAQAHEIARAAVEYLESQSSEA